MSAGLPPVFDGHNDTVLSLLRTGRSFFEESEEGHIDLPRARRGGLGGGFFAVYIIDQSIMQARMEAAARGEDPDQAIARFADAYADEANWPEPMALDYAQSMALTLLGELIRTARQSNGEVRIVRTAAELQECLDSGVFAMLLHFEGAEPLDESGRALEVFYAAGLRSVGLTHSRRNHFTQGVPFAFPASPDTGPGLNDAGRALVRQLNAQRVMIDLSHITERGFWDVAEISDAPLVATHSNAWDLSNTPRNLTVEQLRAIKESRGVAGLNFHVGFLRADGAGDANTSISTMVDHIERMVEIAGIDCVALGSDFDGAIMSAELRDTTGLPKLLEAIKARGYSDVDLTKIAHGNWVRVLRETWGE
jgi:membrane dipeptidase